MIFLNEIKKNNINKIKKELCSICYNNRYNFKGLQERKQDSIVFSEQCWYIENIEFNIKTEKLECSAFRKIPKCNHIWKNALKIPENYTNAIICKKCAAINEIN